MTANILIVDDEPVIRTLLTHAFKNRTDWVLTCVDSAEAALKQFKTGGFDLVVVDKNLPGIDGVALVRLLRSQDPHVGISMITGFGTKNNAVEMLHLGVDCYIEKPFTDMDEIARQFKLVINKSQKRREQDSVTPKEAATPTADSATQQRTSAVKDQTAQHAVLVVTENRIDQDWFARHLSGKAQVHFADTSQNAIQVIAETPTDLVIVDTGVSDPGVEAFIAYIHDSVMGVEVAVMTPPLPLPKIKHFIELDVVAILDLPLNEAQCKERLSKWCH